MPRGGWCGCTAVGAPARWGCSGSRGGSMTEPPLATCREVSRRRNRSAGLDRIDSPGETALVVCPDASTAQQEAQRIAAESRRFVYDRSYLEQGKRVPRYTV